MLVALTEHQELFQITREISRTELQTKKKEQPFFCPQCKDRLVLKVGPIKIPHFAHSKNSECVSYFSEGESQAHLMGKQQLFSLFEKLHLEPVLEPFLQQIRQRPDILIKKDTTQFAIEFQCSKISPQVVKQRSDGYEQIGIQPIWIIQTPNAQFKTRGLTKLSINHTNAHYINRYKKQRYLITYDVHDELFYYVSNLIPLHRLQYFGVVQALPLMQQEFPFFVPKLMTKELFQSLLAKFTKQRDHYVHSLLLLSRKGVNDRFLRAIYELKLGLAILPNYIGIPVSNTQYFEVFCVEWQVQLFYYMHCHQLTPTSMNVQAIPYFLQWAKLAECFETKNTVAHYLAILKELGVENVQTNIPQSQLIHVLYDELVAIG